MQSELDHCNTDNQGKVIIKKELDLCQDELADEQNSKQQIFQNLQSAKQNIKTLEDENKRHNQSLQSANRNIETLKGDKKVLQNQLNSEKQKVTDFEIEFENLKTKIKVLTIKTRTSIKACKVRDAISKL